MLVYRTLAAKRAALLMVAGLLSGSVYAWAEPSKAGCRDEHFKQTDKDGNGLLSRSETGQGMPRLARNFDTIDANKDEQLSREEIRAFMQSRRQKQGGEAK